MAVRWAVLMPLPGTRVILPGWSDHHRPVAAGTMTATCNLRLPGGTGTSFDKVTGATTTTPHAAYLSGARCRVQAQGLAEAGSQQVVAEQDVTTMPYLVAVDWATAGAVEPMVGDLVDLVAAEDPMLVGSTLTVIEVVRGSLVWERDLICIDHETP